MAAGHEECMARSTMSLASGQGIISRTPLPVASLIWSKGGMTRGLWSSLYHQNLPPKMLNTADFNNATLSAPGLVFSKMNRFMILDVIGPAEESRLQWSELPQNPFNGTAIGAIVLLPRSSETPTQEILLCNIGADWGASN